MSAPLYNQQEIPEFQPRNAHTGLWFERFFNGYQDNGELQKKAKENWIKAVARHHVGDAIQLNQFAQRQAKLVVELQGKSQCYCNDWNFVTGMGNAHPVENGFSWHPTLAVPYLTGASVKGLIRAWVEMNDPEMSGLKLSKSEQEARLKSWFGTVSKNDIPEQTGNFMFFDALPDEPVQLACDIMTPHMGKWYSEGDKASVKQPKALPADWHEPIPIPFLVVKKTNLIFYIAARKEKNEAELDAIFTALTEALEWLGAGAKTAVGYGYFTQGRESDIHKPPEMAKDQLWLEQNLAALEASTHTAQDKVLFAKSLAAKWQAIKEPNLKQSVKSLIKQQWGDRWNTDQVGSSKKAYNIYQETP